MPTHFLMFMDKTLKIKSDMSYTFGSLVSVANEQSLSIDPIE